MKQTFNPQEWLNGRTPETISSKATDNTKQSTVAEDIELITQRIEQTQIDITAGYDNWRDLAFALSEELGESGRSYFHRISRLNHDYDQSESDKQYDSCLKSHGSGITIKTFFQKAKEAGISITTSSTRYADCAQSAKYATGPTAQTIHKSAKQVTAQTAYIEETAQSDIRLPFFSDKIASQLPAMVRQIAATSNSNADADILILGSLTVLSACMPHIKGIYDNRTVYPNLFLFVTAGASSGKGRLALCRHLVEPIHNRLREINEAEMMDYKQRLAEYNAAGKKKVNMEKPEEPPMRMLFIPANSSATAVYQVLHDNGGEGLMFETEGDTLANTFSSDYGNYSDGFRKAFHHETISYIRRKDREYVNIAAPKLSTLLTGTPKQILNLITDAENGLFSRFIFYYLNVPIQWNDVFHTSADETLDDTYRRLGAEYFDLYNILKENKDLTFRLTSEQAERFNRTFDSWQDEYLAQYGDEFIASVRRLGVITFRIAMCLSVLRLTEDGNFEDDIQCLDTDFDSAITIAGIIIQHNAYIFSTLPRTAPTMSGKQPVRTASLQDYLNALPSEFDRPTYIRIAQEKGLVPRSIDRTIRKWTDQGILQNTTHGHYRKTNTP